MRDWVGGQSFPLDTGNSGGRRQILEEIEKKYSPDSQEIM